MFPLRDTRSSGGPPWATIALVILNVAAFLHESRLAEPDLAALIGELGLTPARFVGAAWPLRDGFDPAVLVSLVSHQFLHADFLHLAVNLWFLWIFGDNVEARVGRLRFLAFVVATGCAAGAVHVVVDPASTAPLIGASGAVAGVMGAYLRLFPRGRVLALVPLVVIPWLTEIPAWLFLALWFALQFFGLGRMAEAEAGVGGVAFDAHIGGFVAGWIGITALATGSASSRDQRR